MLLFFVIIITSLNSFVLKNNLLSTASERLKLSYFYCTGTCSVFSSFISFSIG